MAKGPSLGEALFFIFPVMNHSLSEKFFAEAKNLMPGGVNSPVRAFGNVGATPPFIARAKGSHIYDVDGND